MAYNYKLDIFNKLTFLYDLASKGISSFPNEISLFIMRELDLKSVVLLHESKEESLENSFAVIGKTASAENIYDIGEIFRIKHFSKIIEEQKFNNHFVSSCEIEFNTFDQNLQSIVFGYNNNSIGIILLVHKNLSSNEELEKYFSITEIVSQLLTSWKNTGGIVKSSSNLQFTDLIIKSAVGFKKISTSINELLDVAKDEIKNNTSLNVLDKIKTNNQFMLNSINDLNELTKFEKEIFIQNVNSISIAKLIEEEVQNYKSNYNDKINFVIEEQISETIQIDKGIFTKIVQSLIATACLVSEDKSIIISSKISSSKKIFLSVTTYASQIDSNLIQNFKEPFAISNSLDKSSTSTSGLSLTLLKKYIEQINGSFKISIDQEDRIKFIISIKPESKKKRNNTKSDNSKNKVLIIESDEVTSILLQTHLGKWNYKAEFTNSGKEALELLEKEKYISIILNIDQNNENSLEILQKIKNRSTTRNIPVIIFSIKPETEQIYLMGSVEYLVKPINYNNLVEILTSYKLSRNSNILCVDDDKPTLNLLEKAIKTAGYNSIIEHRSELVIDKVKNSTLDLAIIDLDMPNTDGVELIKQIKSIQNFAKLPIIIYTGKEDYQNDLEAIEGMFVELLEKRSTSFNELEKTISEIIALNEVITSTNGQTTQNNSPKILMAEDYKHSQIIVTRLLKKNGFQNITVVENGKEALEICKKESIDIILMDMQMPVMNGFEATGKIRELDGYEDTPIIALTAFAMKGDREKCLEAGATDYIAKPIDSKEFIEKVKYYSRQEIQN